MATCHEQCAVCTDPSSATCLSSCSNSQHWQPSSEDEFGQWPFLFGGVFIIVPGLFFFLVQALRRRMARAGGICCWLKKRDEPDDAEVGNDANEEDVLSVYICAMDASDEAVHRPLVLGQALKIFKQDTATVLDQIGKSIQDRLTFADERNNYHQDQILFVKSKSIDRDKTVPAQAVYQYDPTRQNLVISGAEKIHVPLKTKKTAIGFRKIHL